MNACAPPARTPIVIRMKYPNFFTADSGPLKISTDDSHLGVEVASYGHIWSKQPPTEDAVHRFFQIFPPLWGKGNKVEEKVLLSYINESVMELQHVRIESFICNEFHYG